MKHGGVISIQIFQIADIPILFFERLPVLQLTSVIVTAEQIYDHRSRQHRDDSSLIAAADMIMSSTAMRRLSSTVSLTGQHRETVQEGRQDQTVVMNRDKGSCF